jgi:hypothetical protein
MRQRNLVSAGREKTKKKEEELLLPVNSDSTECVDEDTGGEVAPSHVVVDEAAVDPASDGVVLLAPCKAKQNQNQIQKKKKH